MHCLTFVLHIYDYVYDMICTLYVNCFIHLTYLCNIYVYKYAICMHCFTFVLHIYDMYSVCQLFRSFDISM